jgi:hypothetical protein
MTESEKLETPTDELNPSEGKARKKVPGRGTRKRVLGEGEGDYCIYEMIGQGSEIPKGSLVPVGAPRFEDTIAAMKWLRNEGGHLAGKQVMVWRACEIVSLEVETKPTVIVKPKPKITTKKGEEKSDG